MIRLVSVSGGKDSTACLLLALERHPREEVRAVFADTGNEHAQTYEYIDYLERATGVMIHRLKADFAMQIERKAEFVRTKWPLHGVSQDKVERALAVLKPTGNPYLDLCIWKGRFPSRKAQFCTEQLKTLPLTEYALELIDQHGAVESWQGVRADESLSRRDLPERDDQGGGLTIYRPIIRWTAMEVFAFIASKGIEANPLYRQGMGRVGCMPCINARKDEVLEIAKRFPAEVDRIEEWEHIVKEASKRDGTTFFAAANHGEDLTVEESVLRGNIRSIVEWSKTSRGGTQYDFIRMDDEPLACASAYGLCE